MPARGCTPGLGTRWLWWAGPERDPPEVDDIAIRPSTGSCWRVVGMRRSRKGGRWWSMRVEGLGVGAAELGEDGTFAAALLTSADYETIRLVEAADRIDASSGPVVKETAENLSNDPAE